MNKKIIYKDYSELIRKFDYKNIEIIQECFESGKNNVKGEFSNILIEILVDKSIPEKYRTVIFKHIKDKPIGMEAVEKLLKGDK